MRRLPLTCGRWHQPVWRSQCTLHRALVTLLLADRGQDTRLQQTLRPSRDLDPVNSGSLVGGHLDEPNARSQSFRDKTAGLVCKDRHGGVLSSILQRAGYSDRERERFAIGAQERAERRYRVCRPHLQRITDAGWGNDIECAIAKPLTG